MTGRPHAPPPIVGFFHDLAPPQGERGASAVRDLVGRFLALENRYAVRATYNIAGRLFEAQPDLVRLIQEAGHEIAFCGDVVEAMTAPHAVAKDVRRCRRLSSLPTGYRTAKLAVPDEALATLWHERFLWIAGHDPRAVEPSFSHRGLVRVPIRDSDRPGPLPESVEQWGAEFQSALGSRPFIALGLALADAHRNPAPWLAAWDRQLQAARDRGARAATFAEAADLFRRAAVSRHFTLTAPTWNETSKTLYRSRRFQEIARELALSLNAPVVADLASGGGVQSAAVRDVATRVHCVDNAPGMVASIPHAANVDGRLGELTATGLPAGSIDLVLCLNAIEFLYWPEDLADEIKRIARPGAACVVAFPAEGGCPYDEAGSPSDRVERHFTRDEVLAWAGRVGAGHVTGVQYDAREPRSDADEQRYRRLEATPPSDRIPMFWLFVGRVERPPEVQPRALIPLESCPFLLPDQRHDRFKGALERARLRLGRPIGRMLRALTRRTSAP